MYSCVENNSCDLIISSFIQAQDGNMAFIWATNTINESFMTEAFITEASMTEA